MVTGVRIEGHQVIGAQVRMEREQAPLPGGNDSARARLGAVVSALRNDSGQLRSGYLRLAANQDGSYQLRAGHSLLAKGDQARARDYVLQTIKDAYGDVPGMDQAIRRYLSSGQAGGKLGTVSTLKLIQSLEQMRLQTTGQGEGHSELLAQAQGIAVDSGKTGRLDTGFTASAQADWKQAEHLSQGWAKLAPQVRAMHVDVNAALSKSPFDRAEGASLAQQALKLSRALNALKPRNPQTPDFAIKQAWIKTPEGRQMSDQLRAMEWKVLLLSLTSAHMEWQADFSALKPGEDHSALRQEAAKHLSETEAMFKHVKGTAAQADLQQMEKHLGGSQKLNSQLTQAMSSHIALMKAGIRYVDDLPKPQKKDVPEAQAHEAHQAFMAFLVRMNAQSGSSAGVQAKDGPAFDAESIKDKVAQSPKSSMELSPDEDDQIDDEFSPDMVAQMKAMGFFDQDDPDASSSHSSAA